MQHPTSRTSIRRIGLIAAATAAALLMTAVLILAQTPNFEDSYKTGPAFADANDIITYTIVVVNTGDAVEDVVLSDTLPSQVTLLSCSVYTQPEGTALLPCDPSHLWTRDVAAGERVTTTITVQVNVGTLQFPLVNQAHITWPEGVFEPPAVSTMVNPFRLYMPVIARNHS